MARALFVLMVAPLAALTPAQAQTGGIQVSPVMLVLRGDDNIASLRVRNGRPRPIAFEVDVYAWRQSNGEEILTPTEDVLVAPGVFEIAANSEQVVRLGVMSTHADAERSYRIIMRELPTWREDANVLGFALELSLPVFVTPEDARASLETRISFRDGGRVLLLNNSGRAHLQISSVDSVEAGAMPAPRYLLAGASAEILLPPNTSALRVRAAETSGAHIERLVHVDHADNRASVR